MDIDNEPTRDQTINDGSVNEALVRYNIAIDALKKASSDTQKFSALFVVTKAIIKPDSLTTDQFVKLFKAIGWKFLHRLLSEAQESEDSESPFIYQSIALSILSSFYKSIPNQIDKNISVKFFEAIKPILRNINELKTDDEKQMLNDIIICLSSFIQTLADDDDQEHIKILFDLEYPKMFLQLNVNPDFHDQLDHILCLIARKFKWVCYDPLSFNEFMNVIANEFQTNQDQRKFDLCEELNTYIKQNSDGFELFDLKGWVRSLSNGLYDIFRSKLSKNLRDPALKLTSALTESFRGYRWIRQDQWDVETAKYLFVLTRLACIEIKINIESENIDLNILAICYILLEHSIMTLISDDDGEQLAKLLPAQNMCDLLTAIKDSMAIIIEYLQRISSQSESINSSSHLYPITIASIRVLCVWITEETEALRNEISNILPFIIQVMRSAIQSNDPYSKSIFHTVIPAFESLCSDDDNMKIILKQENFNELMNQFKMILPENEIENDLCKSLEQLLT